MKDNFSIELISYAQYDGFSDVETTQQANLFTSAEHHA
jgi:hypothetical protein